MSDIINTLKSINAESFSSQEERRAAVAEAHALISRIESPWDTSTRLTFTIPTMMAAIKSAVDLQLFEKWYELNEGVSTSANDLHQLVKCKVDLFHRILRHLAASNVLWIDDNGLYKMTPYVTSLLTDDLMCTVHYFFDIAMPVSLFVPVFLKDIDYQDPTGDFNCFKRWSNENVWEYLKSHPEVGARLDQFMKASSKRRGRLIDVFPITNFEDVPPGQPLIVDIGGSMGHDLQALKTKVPDIKGRLIVQDQPSVIETAGLTGDLDASIELQAHDFFTTQTIKDCKIYLLRAILHDWPDADAKRILDNVTPAMKKGYSKLLIQEVVVPVKRPDVEATGRDWTMMYIASGAERTEDQWREMLHGAGLKIVKIWHNPLFIESVIETELA